MAIVNDTVDSPQGMVEGTVRASGVAFVVAFALGLLLVGDQAGAFADSDRAFAEIFSEPGNRIRDIVGSIMLIAAAIAFGVFTDRTAHSRPAAGGDDPVAAVIRVSGLLAAAAMLAAAAAFMTVPASLALGDFYGDPGIVSAQPILPHLGYTVLVAGSATSAAVAMVATSLRTTWNRSLVWLTRAFATALVVAAPSVIGMLLLPLWVGFVVVQLREQP